MEDSIGKDQNNQESPLPLKLELKMTKVSIFWYNVIRLHNNKIQLYPNCLSESNVKLYVELLLKAKDQNSAVLSYLKYETVQRWQCSKTTMFSSSFLHQFTVQVDKNKAIIPERAVWYSSRPNTTWVQSLVCCLLCLFPGIQNVCTYLLFFFLGGGGETIPSCIHSNPADEKSE